MSVVRKGKLSAVFLETPQNERADKREELSWYHIVFISCESVFMFYKPLLHMVSCCHFVFLVCCMFGVVSSRVRRTTSLLVNLRRSTVLDDKFPIPVIQSKRTRALTSTSRIDRVHDLWMANKPMATCENRELFRRLPKKTFVKEWLIWF